MAFRAALAERIGQALARKRGVEEKKTFGGVGFLLNGNMLSGRVQRAAKCVGKLPAKEKEQ
jgi:hypothetical protein